MNTTLEFVRQNERRDIYQCTQCGEYTNVPRDTENSFGIFCHNKCDQLSTCTGCGEDHVLNANQLCKECAKLHAEGAFEMPPLVTINTGKPLTQCKPYSPISRRQLRVDRRRLGERVRSARVSCSSRHLMENAQTGS